jgi:hypothetical protein
MENIMKEISSDKLEEMVNRKTGKDFHWFFEQYLYNRFTPELHYSISKGNFLYFYWEKANADYEMPVKVLVNGAVQDIIIPGNSRVGSLELKGDNPIVKFNDSEFLFKPVEDKNAHTRFNRQQKGIIGDF